MTNDKFLKDWSNAKVKIFGTNKNIQSQGIFLWNIKALALAIQMLLEKLKYSKGRLDSKVKVKR